MVKNKALRIDGEIITFFSLLSGFLFFSIINNGSDEVIHLFYSVFYLGVLFFLIYISRKDLVNSFLAIGFFLYFYQVPFLFSLTDSRHAVYNIVYDQWAAREFYLMISIVLTCFSTMFYFFTRLVNAHSYVNDMKENIRSNNNPIFYYSFIFASSILVGGIVKSGGFYPYISLDKFEADKVASFLFLSYKFFVLIMSVSCFSAKRLGVGKLMLILIFVIIELLTAKRFLIMAVGVLFFLLRFKKISLWFFLGLFLSVFFANFLKYIYYSLPNAILNNASDFWSSVFYFRAEDVLMSSFFIGEFSAHIRLSYLNIYHNLNYGIADFVNLMLSGFPFSNSLFGIHYESVGEMFRVHVGEPWAGLASSVYIMPYLSLSALGVLLVYAAFFVNFYCLLYLGRKNLIFSLVALSLLPLFTFYINREPFLLIGKSIFLMSSSVALVWLLFRFVQPIAFSFFIKRDIPRIKCKAKRYLFRTH